MYFWTIFCLMLIGCSSTNHILPKSEVDSTQIEFSFFQNHYMVVPVKINGSVTKKFILDTGIGLTLISKSLCAEINCQIKGKHIGKRMSGQAVEVPLSKVKTISLGNKKLADFPVGVFDIEALMPGSDISGFLSLGFFKEFPHTVDYQKNVIRFETS